MPALHFLIKLCNKGGLEEGVAVAEGLVANGGSGVRVELQSVDRELEVLHADSKLVESYPLLEMDSLVTQCEPPQAW